MKYTEWLNEQGITKIAGWAQDGLTDKQIAEKIGVSYSTFRTWRSKSPELETALQNGKDVADRKVERSLFERAIGYTYTEKKITESKSIRAAKTEIWEKHMPGDTTAMIYWLKNRKPEVWRERRDPEELNGDLAKIDALLDGLDKIAKGE